MKIFKYFLIFLIFLVVGTFIATLFSENTHKSEFELKCKCDKIALYDLLSDTSNVRKWFMNATGVLPRLAEITPSEQTYTMIFMDNNQRTTVDQVWISDSVNKTLIIKSAIPDRLDLVNTIQLLDAKSDSIIIHSSMELYVKGWQNRLLMAGASKGLLLKQNEELSALSKLCQ